MQEDLDIRPYLAAVLRRWPLVLGAGLLAALVVAGLAMAQPQLSRGRSSVLIVPTVSQVTLDPRFTTRDATLLTNATFQREALITLASSGALEARVADDLGIAPLVPGALSAQVQVESDGDLIWFTASAADPQQAVRLAESWARTYELMVAELYSRDTSGEALLNQQIADARQRYSDTQAELERFVAGNDLVQLELQIRTYERVLEVSTTAALDSYSDYITRTQTLDLVLADAQTLRAQVASGESNDLTSALSSLALRARSAGIGQLPVQLRFDDPAVLVSDQPAILADLDTFIATITRQRADLLAAAETITQALLDGTQEAGGISPELQQSYLSALPDLRRRYEQLSAEERRLTQSRDIAFASLEVLQRKRDEQQIAQSSPQISVRAIGATAAPPSSQLVGVAVRSVIGGTAGLLVGVALALALDWRRRSGRLAPLNTTAPQQAKR